MRVDMSLIGQENVTISCFLTPEEHYEIYSRWLENNHNAQPGDEMPAKLLRRNAFHTVKRRLNADGADGARLYPLEVHQ